MKTKKKLSSFVISLFLCSMVFLIASIDQAHAIDFLGGDGNISGFLRNETAWRVRHGSNAQEGMDSWDIVLMRNTLQLEIEYRPADWLEIFLMPRFVYDASLDLDRSLERRIAHHRRHDFKTDDDIREIYADIYWKKWRVRIGKQQVMWGEADLFRMSDIVNPLDVSWNLNLNPTVFEEIRIPLWAVDAIWSVSTGYQWAIELLWLPGCLEDGFEPFKLAPEGANWAPPGLPQFMLDSIRASQPEDSLRNSSFGIRIRGVFAGWDTALFYLYSRKDMPHPKEDIQQRLLKTISTNPSRGGALIPGVPLYAHPGKFFEFPFSSRIGATLNYHFEELKTVLRYECVFVIDDPMTDRYAMDRTYERETFSYMIGLDRIFMIPWLNKRQGLTFMLQMFQRWIFNFNHHMADGTTGTDRHQTMFTLIISTNYRWMTIKPQLALGWNPSGEGLIWPSCEFDIGNNWRYGIAANILVSHNQKEPNFGGWRHNDQIYAYLKFQFE